MDPKFPEDYEHHIAQIFQTPELRSEIKAYLRQRLFTTIQNSSLGPSLSRKDVQPVSPKLQTINLLVAEYLLRYRHHFTLSVFACEVPSVSCLSPSLQDTLVGRSCTSSVPFKQEDLHDMLDTLGILRDSSEGQELKKRYMKHQKPLLECLIRILPELRNLVISSIQFREEATNTEPHTACLEAVAAERRREIDNLQRAHNEEVRLLKAELAAAVASNDHQLQQLSGKHAEELATVRGQQGEEQNLRELVSSLQEKLKLAETTLAAVRSEKASEVRRMESDKVEYQTELESLKQKLHLRELSLSEETRRLEREKDGLKKVKKKLQVQQRYIDNVTVALAHSQSENLPEASLLPTLEIELHAKEQQLSELKNTVSKLSQENQSLKNFIERQKRQIDALNIKTADIVSELHAAKDQLHATRSTRSSRYRTSSSDSSPTDDIVKDAKKRIKSIEEEYEAIGRYHKNFQVRHMNESFLSSVHGSSSGQMLMSSQNISPMTSFHPNLSAVNVEVLSPRRHQTQNQSLSTPKSHKKVNHFHSTPVSSKQETTRALPQQNGVHFEFSKSVSESVPILIDTTVQQLESVALTPPNQEGVKDVELTPQQEDVKDANSVTSNNSNGSKNNKNDISHHSVGPMGDAPPYQPLTSPKLASEHTVVLNSSLDKDQVSNENKMSLIKPVASINSFEVKVDDVISTSSSSKHVSHGAAGLKDDVDDFWNM